MSRRKNYNRKKVGSNKKLKRKVSCCNGNKKSNDTNKNHKQDDITVDRSKLMCRRYEEFHENFLNYDKILKFLQKTQKSNPSSVDLIKIGNSTQGKPIYMVLITSSFSNSSPKMAAFIEAGLNGENAIAVSNTLYMIEHLTKNPNFVKIMDYFIIPCCNPDAYDEFIKSKENNNNKSGNKCSTDKNISKEDCDKKDNDQTHHNSAKSDKKGSKKPRCSSPSESNIAVKKRRSASSNDGNDFLNSFYNNLTNDERDTNKPRSVSPAQKKSQNKDSNGSTCEKNKASKASRNCGKSNNAESQGTKQQTVRMDLSLSFPVVLGLNNMSRIPTDIFIEKIKCWKENYTNQSPETRALINAIYNYQFAIKILISLQEGGQAICYPFGFCQGTSEETESLKDVAKKGKCAINGRNFEYGALYDVQGLTYGCLMDFLKVDKSSIRFMYVMKVYKKTPRYNEKEELKQLMRYGCEIMECIKRMTCAVFKCYTNMTGNKKVETERSKPTIDKRSNL